MNKKTKLIIIFWGIIVIGLIFLLTKSLTKPEEEYIEWTFYDETVSVESPIDMPDSVQIQANGIETMHIGYYNRNSFTAANAKVGISYCQSVSGNLVEHDKLPTITSKSYDVEPNNAADYKIIFNENDLPENIYICTIIVYNSEMVKDITEINKTDMNKRGLDYPVYESKQIFLELQRV